MPLPGCPVFPCGHLSAALLVGRQNREIVGHTNPIADLPKLPQGIRSLAELHPGFEADGVDDEVGVDVLGIAVGGYLYFMPRPCLCYKLQTDGMGLLVGDIFPGRKGLDILVEVDPVQLVIGSLGSYKFRKGVGTAAVHAAHKPLPCSGIDGLIFPLTVLHDRPHGADVLFGFLDVGHGCQGFPPMPMRAS